MGDAVHIPFGFSKAICLTKKNPQGYPRGKACGVIQERRHREGYPEEETLEKKSQGRGSSSRSFSSALLSMVCLSS